MIPIDQFKCIVLCRRELRIYDLNTGSFVNKLKGVMNQKMPYYGLHDQNHLVALSRNRMYINLMNIESGKGISLELCNKKDFKTLNVRKKYVLNNKKKKCTTYFQKSKIRIN